ncbi:hypothetical protein A2165_00660 [Candidatus Curtissbacteria bacterium RBG_13_40_7]|uniref:Uncharacterized protein n=1 Tax=Candidatus Curtissbacteria bacterium RBG_13_40_7 TaxID=1797706 RepID=A0A1F5FXT2_9BACT|nr:MAG: hypothetical protein A2165_00660 [Candidatus Curtissbacteria bacterium RBG_13_40_7]
MTKRLLPIAAAVIIIIAVAAAALFFQLKKSSKPSGETPASQMMEEQTARTTSGSSIRDLLGFGNNVTCTITYPSENGETKGTVYVASDERLRGDFTSNMEDKEIDSHMIQDGTYSYIWSSSSPQGTKMKLEDISSRQSPGPESQNQNIDLDQKVDYQCSPWSVDNSKFVPPADIEFIDFTSTMMQMQDQTNTTNQSQKAICDTITDPQAKAACLEATGGN